MKKIILIILLYFLFFHVLLDNYTLINRITFLKQDIEFYRNIVNSKECNHTWVVLEYEALPCVGREDLIYTVKILKEKCTKCGLLIQNEN
jgi:hypothetical protein